MRLKTINRLEEILGAVTIVLGIATLISPFTKIDRRHESIKHLTGITALMSAAGYYRLNQQRKNRKY